MDEGEDKRGKKENKKMSEIQNGLLQYNEFRQKFAWKF